MSNLFQTNNLEVKHSPVHFPRRIQSLLFTKCRKPTLLLSWRNKQLGS